MTDTTWRLGSVKTRNSEAGGRLDYPSDSSGETLALKVKHNLSDDSPHASHGQILNECNRDFSPTTPETRLVLYFQSTVLL